MKILRLLLFRFFCFCFLLVKIFSRRMEVYVNFLITWLCSRFILPCSFPHILVYVAVYPTVGLCRESEWAKK